MVKSRHLRVFDFDQASASQQYIDGIRDAERMVELAVRPKTAPQDDQPYLG